MLRARVGFSRDSDGDISIRGKIVRTNMKDHKDKFPNPPVKLIDLQTAIEDFDRSRTEALDGGRKAFAHKKQCREILCKMLKKLGYYAETVADNDMSIFVLSGFELAGKSGASDDVVPRILKIKQGKSGEFNVWYQAFYRKVIYYELRWGQHGPEGALPNTWMPSVQSRQGRRPMLIRNLTPGRIYSFQVRVYKNDETFTDWSPAAVKMVI